ncbi:MAG: DoxX-like family protein [Flavobacteriaceae bacterium]
MLKKILNLFIAIVWFANGFFCKILNLVPRHQEIVESILETNHSRTITIIIGLSEIIMAIWVISNYKSKFNAISQIIIVATMNIIEFTLAPNLLLWGKLNALFAFLFILLVYYTNFKLHKKHVIIS